MSEPAGPFWKRVEAFRAMGLDPLKWIAGCSVEVERETVVYPAAAAVGDALAALDASWQPGDGPDVFQLRDLAPRPTVHLTRRGRRPQRPRQGARGNPQRASILMRVHQRAADDPAAFADALVDAVASIPQGEGLDAPLAIGGLHAVATPHDDATFGLLATYQPGAGTARGHCGVALASLQITDASLEPLAPEHAAIVVSAAVAPLCALGITEQVVVDPVFDAPGRKATDALAANFAAAAKRNGFGMVERHPLGLGRLFMGAIATGSTTHAVPNRHLYVAPGMEITLTRPFGELAPLAAYLSCLADEDSRGRLAGAGLGLADLARAKGASIEALTSTAMASGRAIAAHCPDFGQPPEQERHIAATFDAGPRGVFGVLDFAARTGASVRLERLPLMDELACAAATDAFLMDNATASAPGCIGIVAAPRVLDGVERALHQEGLRPHRIGGVVGTRGAAVEVPAATARAVASKHMLRGLKLQP